MNDLFLSWVQLADFRVYGDHYTFEFDPQPGITLIVGANGLGKTTLFDGIEWALTGRVSRFDDLPLDARRRERSPLTRLGRPEGAHRVSLQFDDGAPIDRGQGVEPAEAEIVHLLRRPDWPDIGDLGRYLSITHFLGQAASQRFSVRSPRAQWEALKGPAGVDRVNFVKERIGGQSARRAFNRVVEDYTGRLRAAREALEAWEALLAERDRLTQLASSEQAMNPSEVATAANDIAARMQALGVERDWLAAAGAETPESMLNRLLEHINATNEQLRRELAGLQDLATRAQAFVQANAELVAATDLVQELEARRRASSDSLALAEAAVVDGEAALAPAERRAAHAQAQVALLVRTVSARDQLSAAEAAVAAVETALEASTNATEAAAARQSQLEQAITDAGARLELRGRLTHELAQAERRADFSRQWRAADAEVARLEAIVQGSDADALRARRATFIEQQAGQQAEISELNDQLQALDDRQAALAQAVAAIAARLTEEDLHCPVCATEFAPGELLGLASARRADRDPTAQDLANRLAEKTLEEAATTQALRAVDESLIQHAETLTQLTEARSIAASLLQQLAQAGSPDGARTDDVLASQTADLETRLQRITEEIAKSPSLDDLRATAAQVAADLEAEAARRANLGRRRVEGINLAESAKSVLRLTPAFWSEAEGLTVDLASAQAAAEQELASASHALEKARREAGACRLAAESARRKLTDDAAALGEATGRLNLVVEQRKALVNAWRDSGMSGEPDPTRLRSLVDETDRRLQLIVAMAERQRQMTAAYRRWTQDEALRAAECRIQEQAAGERPQARTVQLRATVDSAMADLDRARAARSRMETLVTQMQSTANEYAKRVLEPLNDTIQRFSRPLITWSDAVIVYKAEHLATRAELRPKAVRTEPDGQVTDLDINPNYYFSEGQLSALSVSALLAASTKFHWSRWRALLMDDPLQHNDVIHASAFMDLMRQLVRALRYQVIMSTHDMTEAEFLVRKCQSAGISHRVHELAPPGDDGLVSQAA